MRAALVGLLVSSVAFAQAPEEFALPSFDGGSPDAGTLVAPAPSEPPPPPADLAPVAPPPPRWAALAGSTTVFFTGLTQAYLGLDLAVHGTLHGTPTPSAEVLGEAEGWLLQAGVIGGWGRVSSSFCRGTALCATRPFGGLSLKGGWGRGRVALKDGVTRAQSMYFGQLDVALAHFEVESAPLSPGRRTWELLTRLRLGLQWTAPTVRATTTGVTLLGAAMLEAVPVGDGTQTVSFGVCLGLGF